MNKYIQIGSQEELNTFINNNYTRSRQLLNLRVGLILRFLSTKVVFTDISTSCLEQGVRIRKLIMTLQD